jgi:dipeptidyl aminopeptidase/acylaminoacyl peptidase
MGHASTVGGMADPQHLDVDLFLTLPRTSGLALSPDGTRLVTRVAEPAPDGKQFVGALWDVDPTGDRPPRRLTRSEKGETFATFLRDGAILFTSARPDPGADPDDKADEDRARLWLLPADGGEPRVVAAPPLGVGAARAAREADVAVYSTGRWPGVDDVAADAERAKERKDKGVTAQLFERYPIRFWDHYLSTDEPHLFAAGTPASADSTTGLDEGRDLTPDAGGALHGQDDLMSFDVSRDGSTVVTTWLPDGDARDILTGLAAIDVATGDRRTLASEQRTAFYSPAISPDGRSVVCVRETAGTLDAAADETLWLIDLSSGTGSDLTPDFEGWPSSPVWANDGSAVFFVTSEGGHEPVYRVEVGGDRRGQMTRLTADGSYSDVCPAPDGSALYALRATMSSPPAVVALDPSAVEQEGTALPTPGLPLSVTPPGRVESLTATASDGVDVQSWLVLPPDASANSPAPLVVFIHGGPLAAWSGWHWRWNPHVLAERGYAVLLPNPALSTGFGQPFIDRGWGRWGEAPYTDIVAAVDAVCARPDIDETRTAAMGGSFGGYMANWVAGHTDRFRCIVTHASLWALEQFHGTTDLGVWWEHEFGDIYTDPSRYVANSPDRHVGNIRTPMLVIHGERDHRVPISEALRLWTDLMIHKVDAKFLYFPDENHWVLKPNNVRIWYETVLAFLDHHVLGKDWQRPALL